MQEKRTGVKDFCCLNKIDIVCLQESKLERISDQIFRNGGENVLTDWCSLPAVGTAGGKLIGWNGTVWKIVKQTCG